MYFGLLTQARAPPDANGLYIIIAWNSHWALILRNRTILYYETEMLVKVDISYV